MDVDVDDFEMELRLADKTLLSELDEVLALVLLLVFLVLLTIFDELVVFRRFDVEDVEVDIDFMAELVFELLADDNVVLWLEDEDNLLLEEEVDRVDFLLEEVTFLLDDEVGFLLLDDLVELDLTIVFVTEVFLIDLVVEKIDFPSTQLQSARRLSALYLRNGDVVLGLLICSVSTRQN